MESRRFLAAQEETGYTYRRVLWLLDNRDDADCRYADTEIVNVPVFLTIWAYSRKTGQRRSFGLSIEIVSSWKTRSQYKVCSLEQNALIESINRLTQSTG